MAHEIGVEPNEPDAVCPRPPGAQWKEHVLQGNAACRDGRTTRRRDLFTGLGADPLLRDQPEVSRVAILLREPITRTALRARRGGVRW